MPRTDVDALETLLKQSATGPTDNGLTMDEIAAKLNIGRLRTYGIVRLGVRTGKLLCGRRAAISISGTNIKIPVYRAVQSKTSSRKAKS